MELLCACPVIDLSVKDQWNRTTADVATVECKEILVNRGEVAQYAVNVTLVTSLTRLSRSSGSTGP